YGDDLASLAVARWVRKHAPQSTPALATSSFSAQVQAARAGAGLMLAPLPFGRACGLSVARTGAALARSLAELPDDELWLVGHRALREVPRVAAVWRWLDELFGEAA